MPDYDNTNRGALFKNKNKKDDNHPDYEGNINVKGVELYLSAWIKTSKAGDKYMSLSVKPKDQRPAAKSRQTEDDDIGF